MSPANIKYIGFYNVNEIKPNRSISLAGRNKMDYTISVLKDIFQSVEILSPACVVNNSAKGGNIKLQEGVSLRLFRNISPYNRFCKFFNYYYSQLQLFVYLLKNVRQNDRVLVYHSLTYKKFIIWAKKIKHFKLILELNEIYSDVSQEFEKYRNLEKYVIKYADGFLFSNDLMNDMFNLACKPYALEYGVYKCSKSLSERFDDGKIHIVYAGTFDPSKGGKAAVEAAAYLTKNYHVHILGFGTEKQKSNIKRSIDEVNRKCVATVTYDGLLDGDEFLAFLQQCHIGLSTQNPDAAYNDTSFPSKILTYLANGLQIVSVDIPAISQSKLAPVITFYKEQTPKTIAEAVMAVKNFEPHYELLNSLDNQFRGELKHLMNSL